MWPGLFDKAILEAGYTTANYFNRSMFESEFTAGMGSPYSMLGFSDEYVK